MAEFAKVVRLVVDAGGKAFLFVDGQEFPYHIHADSIETVQHGGDMPYVRFSLMAERVETVLDYTQNLDEPDTPDPEPEPVEWYQGWEFTPEKASHVPDHVLVLEEADPSAGDPMPYLVRSANGTWQWADSPNDRFDAGNPWGFYRNAYRETKFRVMKVRD